MENLWKTNGFKAFLVLNLMNPIPNLMSPVFGFAAIRAGGEYLLMDLDLLGGYYCERGRMQANISLLQRSSQIQDFRHQ